MKATNNNDLNKSVVGLKAPVSIIIQDYNTVLHTALYHSILKKKTIFSLSNVCALEANNVVNMSNTFLKGLFDNTHLEDIFLKLYVKNDAFT